MVAEYNQKIKEEKVEFNISVSFDEKVINKGDVSSESLTRNIGYFELKQIYSDLNLSSFFNKICEGRRITFDSNAINMTLSVLRVLDPGRKQATTSSKGIRVSVTLTAPISTLKRKKRTKTQLMMLPVKSSKAF